MDLTEQDIAHIDQYLNGELGGQEKTAFEARLQAEPGLKAEVALMKELQQGIEAEGQKSSKAMLAGIGASVAASEGFAAYTPGKSGPNTPPKTGGGGGLFKFLLTLATTGALGFYLWKMGVIEFSKEKIIQIHLEKFKQTVVVKKSSKTIIRKEKVIRKDTVHVYK